MKKYKYYDDFKPMSNIEAAINAASFEDFFMVMIMLANQRPGIEWPVIGFND